MKKIFRIIATTALALSLSACSTGGGGTATSSGTAGAGSGTADSASGEKPKLLFFAIGNLGDMGINDLGYNAAKKIADEYNMDLTVVEGTNDASVRETSILDALETGNYDYCISGSWYIQDAVLQNYDSYPDTKIVFYDTAPTSDYSDYPNAYGISFRQDEGSFVTAVYQCMMTKVGKVAAIANQDSPILNDFVTGWLAGVKWYNDNYNANIGYELAYLTDATIQGDYETATVLYGAGYDIVYNIGGTYGLGAARASEEAGGMNKGIYMVGVDYDQWTVYSNQDNDVIGKDNVITSMEKKITDSVYNAMVDIMNGNAEMGNHRYSLAMGGVGLSKNEHYKELTPEEVQTGIDEVEDKIKSGEIVVPSYFDFANYDQFAEYRDNPDSRIAEILG